jgi:3alpha(or 20beta)-hydroxysteroid dehydrogenase
MKEVAVTEPLVQLTGKVVFVTGAAGGQGAAHARLCSRLGARVVLTDLDRDTVAAVAGGIDGETLALAMDVAEEKAWDAAVAQTRAAFGRIDVLVNNAGLYELGPLDGLGRKEIEAALAVNLIGPILGIQRVVPLMREHGGGSIINVASTAALAGYPGAVAYSASKWALRGATRSAARELGPLGIRVNCVCPGAINTQMISEETRSGGGAVAGQPIARPGEPDDIAAAVLYLASDAAAFVTGAVLAVDGGLTAGLHRMARELEGERGA